MYIKWTLAILVLLSDFYAVLASRNGPSDMSIICKRYPSFGYCKDKANGVLSKPGPTSQQGPPTGVNSNGLPVPPPLPTPPPIGQSQSNFPSKPISSPQQPVPQLAPQPLPTPPPIQPQPQFQPQPQQFPQNPQPQPQPLPTPPPAPAGIPQPNVPTNFQPPPQAPQPVPQPAPQPAPSLPAGGLNSIGQPLAFLGGQSNMPQAPGPNSAPLAIGSGTQVGPFAGVGRNTNVDPFSGVNSGTSVNAAGLPIQSTSGVNFGGLIPGGAGLSQLFGGRRRRDTLPIWYKKYLRAKLML